MLKGLRRLDVYPKTLEDFTEKTTTGAVVSLVTLLFVLWLFVSEVSLFMAHEVDPQLFVDTERSDKIRINLDLYFPAMPCSFLTLDAMDSAGELQLDLAHNVFKRRHRGGVPLEAVRENVAQRGDPPRPAPPAANASAPEAPAAAAVAVRPERPACGSCYGAQTRADQCCNTCEEVREAYRIRGWAFANPEGIAQCNDEGFVKGIEESKGEGCQVYGYLLVNKVAGNFHFSPGKSFQAGGAHVHDYGLFRQQFFNVSHNINTLSFGVQFPGVVNPLDRANKTHNTPSNRLYQYYIKVVPTVYKSLAGAVIKSNQYSVTEHERELTHDAGHGLPGVFFMYDLSPITVQYTETKQSLPHFLTSLCAIIGGVFTVASFVDALVHHGWKQLRRRLEGAHAVPR